MLKSRWYYILCGFCMGFVVLAFITSDFLLAILSLAGMASTISAAFKADKQEYVEKKIPDFLTTKEKKALENQTPKKD